MRRSMRQPAKERPQGCPFGYLVSSRFFPSKLVFPLKSGSLVAATPQTIDDAYGGLNRWELCEIGNRDGVCREFSESNANCVLRLSAKAQPRYGHRHTTHVLVVADFTHVSRWTHDLEVSQKTACIHPGRLRGESLRVDVSW